MEIALSKKQETEYTRMEDIYIEDTRYSGSCFFDKSI